MARNLDGTQGRGARRRRRPHLRRGVARRTSRSFTIRGDKGVTNDPTAIHWVGDAIFVEGADRARTRGLGVQGRDGTPVGPIERARRQGRASRCRRTSGSFVDPRQERASRSPSRASRRSTIYEVDTGKRAKLVRKLPTKPPCKADRARRVLARRDGQGRRQVQGAHDEDLRAPDRRGRASPARKNLLVLLRGAAARRAGRARRQDARREEGDQAAVVRRRRGRRGEAATPKPKKDGRRPAAAGRADERPKGARS